ncbi:MAG: flotillin family protein, partial [Epsilonproteobacteria bacterium]|nr:flotillin family protein [Campylobacterota bacterium]
MGLIIAIIILVGLITLGLVFAKLYKRSTKEKSFVRTGLGGQKVIMDGGAVVLPVLQEIVPVNMNTLKLEVSRRDGQALITKDRLRVDVLAEFYVRVKPSVEAISNAAQTLGKRTLEPTKLKELIEGKFVDALRTVAAEMNMEELHENRSDFVQRVQTTVNEDLQKNGLELETVSLTGLDQTDKQWFNPDNVFDAEGLTKLTEAIEAKRKTRNDIERDTALKIQQKDLETEKQSLELSKEEEYAKLTQSQEIALRRAGQMAEIAKEEAEKQRESEIAQITADERIENQKIIKEKKLAEEEIIKNRSIEEYSIEKDKALKLAMQAKEIEISEKAKAESLAKSQANEARAKEIETK